MAKGTIGIGGNTVVTSFGGATYPVIMDSSPSFARIIVQITPEADNNVGLTVLSRSNWPGGVTTYKIWGDIILDGLDATAPGVKVLVPFSSIWNSIRVDEVYRFKTAPTGYAFGPKKTVSFAPAEVPDVPDKLLTADMTIVEPIWRPASQYNVFSVVMSFPGLAAEPTVLIEWSTTPGSYTEPYTTSTEPPEAQWEVVEPVSGVAGTYQLWMRNPSLRQPLAVPKVDYAVWEVDATGFLLERRNWLRFRWRRNTSEPWSPASDYVSITHPTVPIPDPPPGGGTGAGSESQLLWRPLVGRPSLDFGPSRVNYPSFYTKGAYGGYGPQAVEGQWREGDQILAIGDMHGARRSLDGGVTWHHMNAYGLAGWGGGCGAIDPVDPNRIIVQIARTWAATTAVVGLSKDGGNTFPWVTTLPEAANNFHRIKSNQLVCWPVTGGTPATRIWRMFTWHNNGSTGDHSGDVRLYTSTNGGETWGTGVIQVGWFGRKVRRLIQSPYAQGTMYAATSSGLLVTTNDGASWTTLATGDWRDVWEDPVVQGRLLAARYSDGIWVRAAGSATGTGFTQVLAVGNVLSLGVSGLYDTNKRRIYTNRPYWIGNDRYIYCQEWNTGSNPISTVSFEYTPSGWFKGVPVALDPSDISGHTVYPNGDGWNSILPSQTNALDAVMADGFGMPWKTVDGGRTWRVSGTGFMGENWQGWAFDRNDPNWVGMGLADVFIYESDNKGDFFVKRGYNGNFLVEQAGILQSWCCGGFQRVPDHASVPANKRGRRIAFAGNNHGNCLLVRRDASVGAWSTIAGATYRNFIRVSPTNYNLVYAYNLRSFDAGDTWGGMTYPICGVSVQNGNHVIGHNGAGTFLTSTDAGTSFVAWFSTGVSINFGAGVRCALSPHDWTKFIVPTSNGDVVFRNGAAQTTLNLRGALQTAQGSIPSYWNISALAWCPINPRRIYAMGDNPGGSMVWQGILNESYTACTWTDITTNFPRTVQPCFMETHPITGELYAGKGAGVWVKTVPVGETPHASSTWVGLPKPLPNGQAY